MSAMTCPYQDTDREDCLEIDINNQAIEIAEMFCCIDDTTGPKVGAVDSVTTRISSRWNKFRDLVSLLTSKGLPIKAKSRLNSTCVCSVTLH